MVLITQPTEINIPNNERPNRNNQVLAALCQSTFVLPRDFTVEFSGIPDVVRAVPDFGIIGFRYNDNGINGYSPIERIELSDALFTSPNLRVGVTTILIWPRLGSTIDVTWEAIEK